MCIVRVIVSDVHLDLLRMRHGHCVHGALLIYERTEPSSEAFTNLHRRVAAAMKQRLALRLHTGAQRVAHEDDPDLADGKRPCCTNICPRQARAAPSHTAGTRAVLEPSTNCPTKPTSMDNGKGQSGFRCAKKAVGTPLVIARARMSNSAPGLSGLGCRSGCRLPKQRSPVERHRAPRPDMDARSKDDRLAGVDRSAVYVEVE